MYRVDWKGGTLVGLDDSGMEKEILVVDKYIQNISRVPMVMIENIETKHGKFTIPDLLKERNKLLDKNVRYSSVGISQYVLDALIVDFLIKHSAPKMIGLIDVKEQHFGKIKELIDFFNENHKVYDIKSADYKGYRFKGFSLLILFGKDDDSYEQWQAAGSLLGKGGLLCCFSENATLFNRFADIWAKDAISYNISNEYKIYKLSDRNIREDLLSADTLNKEFLNICKNIDEMICKYEKHIDSSILRNIAIQLKELAKDAQNEWNLELKQDALNLRTAVQDYYINKNDLYIETYRERLLDLVFSYTKNRSS